MKVRNVVMHRQTMDKKSIAAVVVLIGIALVATAYL